MRITLSVNGRFHSFDVARELSRRQQLCRLITSYPGFVARRWGLPPSQVRALPAIELLKRVAIRVFDAPGELLCAPYDLLASHLVPEESELVETWSGSSLHTLARARALGAVSVLKRSSAHIVTQRELLQEEYRRWGMEDRTPIPAFIVERELREYDEADYVLTSSRFIARTFRDRGVPPHKVLCLPLAVDTSSFRAAQRDDRTFRVLFCGAASLRKGVPYLLKAFASLALPDAELWFVGGIAAELRPLFARLGGPNVRVLGSVPHGSLPAIYQQCDVLCLPSIEEGFGTVVTQAMACGLPVIVSENVGAADALAGAPDAGCIVPIRDARALADAILGLYEDRVRCRAMGQRAAAALRRGDGCGSWSDYAERLLALYRSLRGLSDAALSAAPSPA